jgi:transposase-like protein
MKRERPALFKGRHFEAEIIVLCVRWYLRYPLSFRQLEEIMAERNLTVDHVTIWRWVQRYAPELNRRCRPELRNTNRSWRVDETYCRVAGKWTYLYRAVDSTGATIDFLLSGTRDAVAAKRFLHKALRSAGHPRPRVINVDRNPSYPKAISELKRTGELGRRCRCRAGTLPEQHRRAGSQSREAAGPSESGISGIPLGGANASGNRNDEHDPQRTGEMASKERHRGPSRIHRAPARCDHGVIPRRSASPSRLRLQGCNTACNTPIKRARTPCGEKTRHR